MDHFEVLSGLVGKIFEETGEVFLFVEGGNDDGEKGFTWFHMDI